MRLLNTQSLRLELFVGSTVPRYAILSHTWGDEEILFDDLRDTNQPPPINKKGFGKVKSSCLQASQDGYRYIWIDTCCIDKSSSAELSEAINSMFMWYHSAGRCYAYLADFDSSLSPDREAGFERSRWFTRGWTLQELIAPRDVCFYDCNWLFVGRRQAKPSKTSDDSDNSDDNDGGDDSDDSETSENGGRNDGSECTDLANRISDETGIHIKVLRWYVRKQANTPLGNSPVRSMDEMDRSPSEQIDKPGPQRSRGSPLGGSRGRLGPLSSRRRQGPPSRRVLRHSSQEEPSVKLIRLESAPAAALVSALASFSVAQKMSWASHRQTTRLEDEAYSLLGLFGVNMPLLYGEGRQAFFRLQQEILRFSNDQSVLAFTHQPRIRDRFLEGPCSLLADSPACFSDSGEVEMPEINAPVWPGASRAPKLTALSPSQKVLEIPLCLCPAVPEVDGLYFGVLDCLYQKDYTSHPAILLQALDEKGETFTRCKGDVLVKFNPLYARPRFKPSDVSPADFSKASSATVRLYFYPPKQIMRLHARFYGFDRSAPGMRIKETERVADYSEKDYPRGSSPVMAGVSGQGGYPQSVEANDGTIYVPSMKIKPWLREQAQGDDVGTQYRPAAFPFGVVVIRLSHCGGYPFDKWEFDLRRPSTHLMISWGQPPIKYERLPWFAVLDWAKVAEACGLDQDPGPDLVAAARLAFEKQKIWLPWVSTLPALIIEHDSSLGKIRFNVNQIDFFGRPVLDVDMGFVTNYELRERKITEHARLIWH